jgi:hypothetical protein
MSIAAGCDRALLGDAGFLAQAGQGIEFPEDGNHRTTFAGLAHDGCRQSGDIALDPESFLLKQAGMF